MEIGKDALEIVDLRIPQSSSFDFKIVHKDKKTGRPVDHSGDTLHMAIKERDGNIVHDASQYCHADRCCVSVDLPKSFTANLELGKNFGWDIFAVNGEASVRLCAGKVKVIDTYALDSEQS